MSVQTNNVSLAIAPETTAGTIAAAAWQLLEFNTAPDIGADVQTVVREPVSKNRSRRKGAVSDVDSKLTFDGDVTYQHMTALIAAAVMSDLNGHSEGLADGAPFRPTSVTSTAYVVAADGDLTAGRLIRARGFTVTGNNGLKVVGAASDTDEIKTSGLAAETTTPAQNATVELAGVQGASGDITCTATQILSTVLDFTTLGITIGQFIHVGDADNGAAYGFATAACYGLIRPTAITANAITFDKATTTWVTDNGAGKTIRLLFGTFARDVATDNADFLDQYYTGEVTWPNLDAPDPMYEYARGHVVDEFSMQCPTASKLTMKVGFVGFDTDAPVVAGSRATGASAARIPVGTEAFSTSTQVFRLRSANGSTAITTYFKSFNLSIKNQRVPQKAVANLGAISISYGTQQWDIDAEAYFVDADVVAAVRAHTTLTWDFAVRNPDGGFVVDIPECTFGSAKRNMPINESVLVAITGRGHQSATFGYTGSISIFPYLPST